MIIYTQHTQNLPAIDLDAIDLIEMRLDQWEHIDLSELKHMPHFDRLLWTYRSFNEGGAARSLKDRDEVIGKIIHHKPAYLDLEYFRDLKWLDVVSRVSPKTKVILSFHSFDPISIVQVEQKLLTMKAYPVWKYKIAIPALTTLDALKMLLLMKKHPSFIGICMGEKGRLSRLLGPVFSQDVTFTSTDESLAYGQLSLKELLGKYFYPHINSSTKVYGLVGESLLASPGEAVYNKLFNKLSINAVYVNIPIKLNQWEEFIQLYSDLGFHGLSVTAPLKKRAATWSREQGIDSSNAAINTLLFENRHITACNTDTLAVKKLIERAEVNERSKILLVGAGGAAEGASLALQETPSEVFVLNRDIEKARQLVEKYVFKLHSRDIHKFYDVIIKTAPCTNERLMKCLKPHGHLIDLLYEEDDLKKLALEKGCTYSSAIEFWAKQGSEQIAIWEKQSATTIHETIQEMLKP